MRKTWKRFYKKKYLILLIVLIAIFFRFWQLNNVPPGLYPDIATNGTDAIYANETGNWKIFYPANNGREGFFINLIALSFKIFGAGIWQLRLVGSIIGVLTVYGVYLLVKELFNENSALFASLFMATGFWAVNLSRIGFRAIMVPFILVFSFYFLLRKFGDEKKSFWDFIIAGVFFGLGFYTYISFKIAPLILVILFGYLALKDFRLLKKSWKGLTIFLIVLLMIAYPITVYQLESKEAALRTGQVSILNPEVNKGNFIGTLSKTTALSLGMFNFYGDPNWRHNFSGTPQLNPFVGIFFLIGLLVLVTSFLKRGDFRSKVPLVLMLSIFFVMLIPAILTEEGMPHSLRAIGAMVPAFVMAGIGAAYAFSNLAKKKRELAKITGVILVLFIMIFDFNLYFLAWAKRDEVRNQFTTRYVEIAKYLNEFSPSFKKYVVINEGGALVDGFPVQAQTIKFLTYKKSDVKFLNTEDISKLKISGQTIITDLKDDKQIKELLVKNPQAKKISASEVKTSAVSTNFVIYFVDPVR